MAVVKPELVSEDRQNRANQADDDSVEDEARAEQIKNSSLRHGRRLCKDLRFRGHHGILQEPGSTRNAPFEEADFL